MKELSNCEKMVLTCIYRCKDEPNIHDVEALLLIEYNVKWKLQTLCTFLKRMADKGYLFTDKRGRYTYYTPTISYDDYLRLEVDNLVRLYFYEDIDALKHYVNLTF